MYHATISYHHKKYVNKIQNEIEDPVVKSHKNVRTGKSGCLGKIISRHAKMISGHHSRLLKLPKDKVPLFCKRGKFIALEDTPLHFRKMSFPIK